MSDRCLASESMSEERRIIRDHAELGRLWLAWYVRRSDETQVADLTQHVDDARRVGVAEFCAKPDRFAAVRHMKMPRIEEWIAEYAQRDHIAEHDLDALI